MLTERKKQVSVPLLTRYETLFFKVRFSLVDDTITYIINLGTKKVIGTFVFYLPIGMNVKN